MGMREREGETGPFEQRKDDGMQTGGMRESVGV